MSTIHSFQQFIREAKGEVGFIRFDTDITDLEIYDYQDMKCEGFTFNKFADAPNFRMMVEHLGDIIREYTRAKDENYIGGEIAGFMYRYKSEREMTERHRRAYTEARYAQLFYKEDFLAWRNAYEGLPVNSEALAYIKLAIHFVFENDYRSALYNLDRFCKHVGYDADLTTL